MKKAFRPTKLKNSHVKAKVMMSGCIVVDTNRTFKRHLYSIYRIMFKHNLAKCEELDKWIQAKLKKVSRRLTDNIAHDKCKETV